MLDTRMAAFRDSGALQIQSAYRVRRPEKRQSAISFDQSLAAVSMGRDDPTFLMCTCHVRLLF